jgi:hypothetical protein
MNKWLKLSLFGICLWAIPFLAASLFYNNEGMLTIDPIFFKTIMLLVSSISTAYFIIAYFKQIKSDYLRESVILGVLWFTIQFILDFLILIPMSDVAIPAYVTSIGLRYLMSPIMTITVGIVVQKAKQN